MSKKSKTAGQLQFDKTGQSSYIQTVGTFTDCYTGVNMAPFQLFFDVLLSSNSK